MATSTDNLSVQDTSGTNAVRTHYSDLVKTIGAFPDLLLAVSNSFYQHSFIDLHTKISLNQSGGLTGASMLLDHIMMKIEQSDQYLPLVMAILREEVALRDIVHKMESNKELAIPGSKADSETVSSEPGSVPISPLTADTVSDVTVDETISAAEKLKNSFELLCFLAMKILNQSTVNLALLKLKICLRLQYARDNTPPTVRGHLTELEQCTAESFIMFLINRNFLGYLNFDLLESFKPVLSSDEFDQKLEEYQLAHKKFITKNFRNIVEAFNQKPCLRPASIIWLPEIKVELASPWKSKSLYYWKELVNDIIDWNQHIVITRVEFNCISITYQVLPFIIPRIVKDLTNETIMKRFTAIGATFTIPDELLQDGIADNQWIMDTVHEQRLLKKTIGNDEGDDPASNAETTVYTDKPLKEDSPEKFKSIKELKRTGGYDDELFLSPPPEDLQCPVCHLIVREPHQLTCCGATLCQVCSNSTSASVQCPCCRDTNHQIMVDKKTRGRVMSLKVKCSVTDCHWTGELLDLNTHLTVKDKCPQPRTSYDASIVPVWCHQELSSLHYGILPVYRTIENFSKHKESSKGMLVTDPFYTNDGGYRATLAVNPNGCGSGKGTHVSVFINLTEGANDDVLEFPINGIFTTQILDWSGNNRHIEECIPFNDNVSIECRERITTNERAIGQGIGRFLPHDDLMSYLHHDMMCFKIDFYPINETGCFPVPSWCDTTYSTSTTPPCTRVLYSYSTYKKTKSPWFSQPFYSTDKGYKLQLRVVANGSGSGKGTHLSLYVVLMKGEYDDTLSWPFSASVTVQLLNWSADNRHSKDIIHHYKATLKARERVIEGVRAPGAQGSQFIPHASLESPSDPTVKFINNDNICFRIINIELR